MTIRPSVAPMTISSTMYTSPQNLIFSPRNVTNLSQVRLGTSPLPFSVVFFIYSCTQGFDFDLQLPNLGHGLANSKSNRHGGDRI
jgi:hypothetical protein